MRSSHLYGAFQYWLAVLLVLCSLRLLGMAFAKFSSYGRHRVDAELSHLRESGLGLGVLVTCSAVFSKIGLPLSTAVIRGSLVLMAIVLLLSFARLDRPRTVQFSQLRAQLRHLADYGLVSLLSLLPYVFLFRNPIFEPGFGTSASWTNNDVGAYLQMATNVVRSGFDDSGLVQGWNAGMSASFDHPGAMTSLAAVASLLGREPFQVGIVAMCSLLAVMILAASSVVKSRHVGVTSGAFLLSSAVVLNPLVVSVVANFFFAQVQAVTLVMVVVATLWHSRDAESTTGTSLVHALLMTSAALTSIEIAVALVPLLIGLHAVSRLRVEPLGKLLRLPVVAALVFGLIVALNWSLFEKQFEVLRRTTVDNVAGWSSYLVSPSMLLGLSPTSLGSSTTGLTREIDLILTSVLIGFVLVLFVMRGDRFVPLALASLIGITIVATTRWGPEAYQTWKLFVTLSPFFLLFGLVGVHSLRCLWPKSSFLSLAPLILSTFVASSTFVWSAYIWRDAQPTGIVRPELASLAASPEVRRQEAVDVVLSPFFETMAASSMLGVPVWMVSPSYQFPNGNTPRNKCTLTTVDRLGGLGETGSVIARRGNYVLVGSPRCD